MKQRSAIAIRNSRRIARGRMAITRYVPQTGASAQECLTDLLSDIRHAAAADPELDVDAAIRTSELHFDAERTDRPCYGTAPTSGGRWGVAKRHAVVEQTIQKSGRHSKTAIARCGTTVYPYTGHPFDRTDEHSCRRCVELSA